MRSNYSVLLCESCGYEVGGLAEHGQCPECGRLIAESLPSQRSGSPWQVRRSIGSWVRTNYLMIRKPSHVFNKIRVDQQHLRSLLAVNLFIAGFLISAVWVDTLVGFPARDVRHAAPLVMVMAYAQSAAIGILAVASVLFALTFIEVTGIKFFAHRRGWRITSSIAWQICAHASIGWVMAAVFSLLSLVVWLNLSYFGLGGWAERAKSIAGYLLASVPLVGFLVGMFMFELLVYTGMQRCRFANAPR